LKTSIGPPPSRANPLSRISSIENVHLEACDRGSQARSRTPRGRSTSIGSDDQLARLRGQHASRRAVLAAPGRRLWWIGGEVDASRAAEAARSTLAILDDMRRDPETYREAFMHARQKVRETMLASLSTSTITSPPTSPR
jgi:hypothetical protein